LPCKPCSTLSGGFPNPPGSFSVFFFTALLRRHKLQLVTDFYLFVFGQLERFAMSNSLSGDLLIFFRTQMFFALGFLIRSVSFAP
jgi:hypothetical protein